jgi:hypothetical protein
MEPFKGRRSTEELRQQLRLPHPSLVLGRVGFQGSDSDTFQSTGHTGTITNRKFYNPCMDHHAVAAVSITGTCLDVVGSLYLAYDLLGGQDGPLRLLLPDTDAFFTAIESRINRSFCSSQEKICGRCCQSFFAHSERPLSYR